MENDNKKFSRRKALSPRTRAPAHPRTRAPAHPRTRAPAHQIAFPRAGK